MSRAAYVLDKYAMWLFPLPAIIAIIVLCLAPMLTNFVLSMYSWFIGGEARMVGLGNYTRALSDPRFWNGVRNTFYFTFVAVPIQLVLGLGIALLFNRQFPGKAIARTVILLPMVATPVAIALIWALMFNPSLGILNHFLSSLGLPRMLWVAEASTAIPSLVLVDVWQWSPMIALILLAALQTVPSDYYEAALIDGANGWQIFWNVTLPWIRSAMVIAVILRSLDALKTFDIIYVITEGGPGTASETLNVLAYKTGFQFLRAGYAATLLIFLLFIVLGVSIFLNFLRSRT